MCPLIMKLAYNQKECVLPRMTYGIKKGAKAIKIFVPQKITYLKNESGDWIQLSKADKPICCSFLKCT